MKKYSLFFSIDRSFLPLNSIKLTWFETEGQNNEMMINYSIFSDCFISFIISYEEFIRWTTSLRENQFFRVFLLDRRYGAVVFPRFELPFDDEIPIEGFLDPKLILKGDSFHFHYFLTVNWISSPDWMFPWPFTLFHSIFACISRVIRIYKNTVSFSYSNIFRLMFSW